MNGPFVKVLANLLFVTKRQLLFGRLICSSFIPNMLDRCSKPLSFSWVGTGGLGWSLIGALPGLACHNHGQSGGRGSL